MQTTMRRRTLGSFYTPDWIARWMVARSLSADRFSADFTVLDPACGDGAFVMPVLDWIAEHRGLRAGDGGGRLAIVRNHVFGVDADLQAIDAVRRRVGEWIGGNGVDARQVTPVLTGNFRHGDSLVGRDWLGPHNDGRPSAQPGGKQPDPAGLLPDHFPHCPSIDFPMVFPHVAAAGGFDLVIGNPPYRRERDSKREFDRIAATPLGQRWRTARMDLWHYFLHRGLDLLKPGGRLAFIVNSYWTSSAAAGALRQRVAAETILEEIVLLGAARVFPDVSGRHMIFRVCKGGDSQSRCQVHDLSHHRSGQIQAAFAHGADIRRASQAESVTCPQSDLWSAGRLCVANLQRPDDATGAGPKLGELFEVRQGMAENPPFVTKAAALLLGNPSLTGRGVFVLSADEIESLRLSPRERLLLRPYYALSTVGRFQVARQPSHQVLYLTRRTAPVLEELPAVRRHLERFRVVLERRREVQSGQIAWWHLHWPREERLFTSPRVLSLQMGCEPRFAHAEQPTYVGFSMHVIVDRQQHPRHVVSLAALAAILNSPRARRWFETHAKRRGANLDISGTVLKQFPLPASASAKIVQQLDQLARDWPATPRSESRLNTLVNRLYTP